MTFQHHMLGLLQGQEYSLNLLAPYTLPKQQDQSSILSSISRDPREHWHFSKSAGNFAVFSLGWFTFFHLIPTLKISSFLFSQSCHSKMYWICRCNGTRSHTCSSWSNLSRVCSGCLFYSSSSNPQSDIKWIFLFNLCMRHSLFFYL